MCVSYNQCKASSQFFCIYTTEHYINMDIFFLSFHYTSSFLLFAWTLGLSFVFLHLSTVCFTFFIWQSSPLSFYKGGRGYQKKRTQEVERKSEERKMEKAKKLKLSRRRGREEKRGLMTEQRTRETRASFFPFYHSIKVLYPSF